MSEASGDNRSDREVSDDRPTEAELAAERKTLTDEQLQEQLRLDELDATVCAAEDELVEHMALRGNYDLLEQACQKLEKLSELGIAELFWGDEMPSVTADAHLADALARIDEFYARLKYLEDQHQAALGKVEGQREVLDVLDYELYQAEQREESRKQEWIVERDATILSGLRLAMPWMRGFEDDHLFRKALAGSVLAGLLLGLIIPFIDLPIPEREELTEVPERFAKLIRKEPVQPVPPPQPVREQLPEETPEEPDPEKIVEPTPEPKIAAEAEPESTKDKVKSVGILAFRENFSNLNQSRPSAKLGSMARVTDAGESAVGRPERAMVTTQGSGSSGGINLAAISRDINGGGVELVAGVALTQVESGIDGGGGTADRPRSAGGIAGRTDEEIQIVFDRYKAALYRLYNRELRKDPTLRGQMVLRLTIEPDGSVSLCNVQSSDMQAPDLAQRVVNSVSGFQFGAKDVPAISILYPIDFLPTA